jgi:hypothetical protein
MELTGAATLEGKATRAGASERWQRMSFNDSHYPHQDGGSLPADHSPDRCPKRSLAICWGAYTPRVLAIANL